MTNEVMRERVAAARVGRLATVGAGGAPHLVPFCFAVEGDVLYSAVDAKPKRTQRLQRPQLLPQLAHEAASQVVGQVPERNVTGRHI